MLAFTLMVPPAVPFLWMALASVAWCAAVGILLYSAIRNRV